MSVDARPSLALDRKGAYLSTETHQITPFTVAAALEPFRQGVVLARRIRVAKYEHVAGRRMQRSSTLGCLSAQICTNEQIIRC